MKNLLLTTLAFLGVATLGHAQVMTGPINESANVWVLISSALVLLMTLPGLALFYGGLVTSRNVLNTLMQCVVSACAVTLAWIVLGYAISFGGTEGSLAPGIIGNLSKFMLAGIGVGNVSPLAPHLPEFTYVMYQMTFAIITAALIIGSIVERVKFSSLLVFMVLWSLVIYAPIAHMVWGGGFLANDGVLDFAGGTVVHINAGVAALVISLVLGPRFGWHPKASDFAPHNVVFSIIGASLLWVGWFGFNGGSALAGNAIASIAILNTQVAAAAATLAWLLIEILVRKRATAVGMITGAVAGLVAITPAAGFVTPTSAIIIGLVAGVLCYLSAHALKNLLCFDDSLDVVGVHGVGGLIGAVLTGVFATTAVGAGSGLLEGNAKQLWIQLESVIFTIFWSGFGTWLLAMAIDKTMGLRLPHNAGNMDDDGFDLREEPTPQEEPLLTVAPKAVAKPKAKPVAKKAAAKAPAKSVAKATAKKAAAKPAAKKPAPKKRK